MTGVFIGAVTGQPDKKINLLLSRANRHGLVAGATGTGKTVTLQVLAEAFSAQGIPVFMTDVKGDLSGICQPSAMQDFLVKRASDIGLTPYTPSQFPAIFWDLYGEKGHPVRTTISEMGPLLLSRLMELNEVQQGVLDVAFRMADDEGLLLLDLKDLRALLSEVADKASELSQEYGNISPQSVATIQRALLRLEEQGAEHFFGEPALNISDMMRVSYDGRGFVNILQADKLLLSPRLYATFLLWLLSELFEELPEAGDLPKPKLVLFFDEAHLLFNDIPKALLEKIEQVVRLIRSKGVGVYFITQNPSDIPDIVLGQLGNKVQHALRAFTPAQKKSISAVVDGFRDNPAIDIEAAVQELKVGEALVSVLNEKGEPTIVERVLVRPPSSLLGMAPADVIKTFIQNSPVAQSYTKTIDRESAYEILKAKANRHDKENSQEPESRSKPPSSRQSSNRQGMGEALTKSVIRAVGSQVSRSIAQAVLRGVLGGLSGRRRG
jgi:DNA helicase HerA-like ATPase